jgi:Na+/proline symporter
VAFIIILAGLPLPAFWAFLLPLVVFALFAFGRARTPQSYFTTERKELLWITLAASHLNVAGGIFALTAGADQFGAYIVWAPITFFIGILLFYWLFKRLGGDQNTYPFDLKLVNRCLSPESGPPSSFAWYYAVSTVVIYTFVLGWELYVVSDAISNLLVEKPGDEIKRLVAFLLALCAAFYTSLGGFDKVVLTDFVQALLVLCFLLVLFIAHKHQLDPRQAFSLGRWEWEWVWLFLNVTLLNITSQIQHPLNWIVARSDGERLKRTVVRAATVAFLFWLAVIFLARALPSGAPGGPGSWLRLVRTESPLARNFFIIGLAALTLSTLDSLVIGSLNFLNTALNIKRSREESEVSRITLILPPFLLMIAFVFALGLLVSAPNIYVSLVSMVSALSVYAGVFILAALKREWLGQSRFVPPLLFLMFILIAFLQFIIQLMGLTQLWSFALVVGACTLGFILPIIARFFNGHLG